jgi:D-xylose 1-dehydrogenase (NADP+, D-xylono-1,5-lactone-forming)
MSADSRRRIRWGVLGYARIARESVMPAIQRSSNATLAGLASRDESKLTEAVARFGSIATYRSYEELLHADEIDAVYIPLPNALHREWAIRAMEAGKHVLCEKPLGLTASECAEMSAAAQRCGVRLMEAFMYRYTDRTHQVAAVLRGGALGEIKHIQSTFRFLLANPASIKLQETLGGGSLYDVGCYPVNFIGWVLDLVAGVAPGTLRPSAAVAESVRSRGIDQIFSGVLKYESGVIATVNSGFNAHLRAASEIVGTDGVLEVPDTFFENPGSLILTRGTSQTEIPVKASDRYRAEVEDFSEAILAKRDPMLGLAESRRNAEVIDQLLTAAK